MNILIIEDEKSLQDSIRKYLTIGKYHCEVASTFHEAVDKIHLYTYDCILVDITLPGGNGLEIVNELKKKRATAGIIVISAKHSLDDKLTGLELGADDYVTKPFSPSKLRRLVGEILGTDSPDSPDS